MMRIIYVAMAMAALLAGGAGAQERLALREAPASRAERFVPPVFSDAEVEAFANALHAATLVDEQWTPRIEAALTAEEARRLSDEAQAEMVEAVEAAGVSLRTFGLIYSLVQGDATLAERVSVAVEKRFEG